MAIYHLNIRHCSLNKGQSAQAKFDYINRIDKYSKKLDDLQYSQSGNMPLFAQNNPELFWQSADKFERANARVCTEIEFALPRELTLEQQQELVSSFIEKTINNEQRKLPYSFAIHNDKANNNPHCHLVFSVRKLDGIERTAEQFFKRANSKNAELGGAKKDRDVIQKEFLQNVRKSWSEQANMALEKYGHSTRIDERSYQEQGIDKDPRSRLDRVKWQELKRLEKESQKLGLEIDKNAKEIATEKARAEIPQEKFNAWIVEKYQSLDKRLVFVKSWIKRYEDEIEDETQSLERRKKERGYGFMGLKTSDQRSGIKHCKDNIEKASQGLKDKKAELEQLQHEIKQMDEQRAKILAKYPHLIPKTYQQIKDDMAWRPPQPLANKVELGHQFKQDLDKVGEKRKNEQKKQDLRQNTGGFRL